MGNLSNLKSNMKKKEEQPSSPIGALQSMGQQKQLPPALQKQINVYSTMLSKFMHGKETQQSVLKMLQSGPVEKTIPMTAVSINEQAERAMKKPKQDVVLAASVNLVADLVDISAAAGLIEEPNEEFIAGVYQDTLQLYIQKGLKDGSIDPIQLQKDVEPLLNDQQRQAGMQAAQATGVPSEPDEGAVINEYANRRVKAAQPEQVQGVLGNVQPGGAPQVQPKVGGMA